MRDKPWLAGLYAHGVRGRIATGPNTGKRVITWGGVEKRRSRNHPGGVALTSMDSAFMQMSASRHIGDRSWKISAAICCDLHWLSSVWSVFPAVA